jgi:septal ring factor EnvC (AmiA/AmiB activator)
MTEKNNINGKNITVILNNSMMVILTLIFVLLYAAAFTGKFDPLKDNTILLRLEPITFILIGYYFGRMPSRQNEESLKEEIARQTQKADAAQYAKEKAQQECETLEEKIKNVKTTLKTIASVKTNANELSKNEYLQAVLNILDS